MLMPTLQLDVQPSSELQPSLLGSFGDRYLDQYFGVWAIEEVKAQGLMNMASSLHLAEHREQFLTKLQAESMERDAAAPMSDMGGGPFKGQITQDGVAVVPVRGTLMKFQSSMSSSSGTVQLRRSIRAASADDRVRGILLMIDSPGGTVAGTAELADDVQFAASAKPVWAFGDDLMASAAYWIGSQANRIGANRTAMVGSLGTVAVLYDYSRAAANQGIQAHVFSTGRFKGAGAVGASLSKDQQEYFQALIDETNTHFVAAVNAGRKRDLTSLFDGRVHLPSNAVKAGLIDEVASADAFYTSFVKALDGKRSSTTRSSIMSASTETAITPQANEQTTTAQVDDAPLAASTVVETPASAGEGVDMSTPITTGATPGAAGGAQPANQTPVAASLAQLKAGCPGASNDFLVSQLEANATVEQARDAYMAVLLKDRADAQTKAAAPSAAPAPAPAAAAARPGTTPVGSAASEQTTSASNAFGEFKAAVEAKVAAGLPMAKAIVAVARANPGLHSQVLSRVG